MFNSGTCLSPNGIAMNTDAMVSMSSLNDIIRVDPEGQTITVQAGIKVSKVWGLYSGKCTAALAAPFQKPFSGLQEFPNRIGGIGGRRFGHLESRTGGRQLMATTVPSSWAPRRVICRTYFSEADKQEGTVEGTGEPRSRRVAVSGPQRYSSAIVEYETRCRNAEFWKAKFRGEIFVV